MAINVHIPGHSMDIPLGILRTNIPHVGTSQDIPWISHYGYSRLIYRYPRTFHGYTIMDTVRILIYEYPRTFHDYPTLGILQTTVILMTIRTSPD